MRALRAWLATLLEFALLGLGLGCLGAYGYATIEANARGTTLCEVGLRMVSSGIEGPGSAHGSGEGQFIEVTVWPDTGTPASTNSSGIEPQNADPQSGSRCTWAWRPVDQPVEPERPTG